MSILYDRKCPYCEEILNELWVDDNSCYQEINCWRCNEWFSITTEYTIEKGDNRGVDKPI